MKKSLFIIAFVVIGICTAFSVRYNTDSYKCSICDNKNFSQSRMISYYSFEGDKVTLQTKPVLKCLHCGSFSDVMTK